MLLINFKLCIRFKDYITQGGQSETHSFLTQHWKERWCKNFQKKNLLIMSFPFSFMKQMKFLNKFEKQGFFFFLFLKIMKKQECNEPKLGPTMQIQLPCLFFFSKNQNLMQLNETKCN